MPRKLGQGQLVVATHNPGKLKEISELVSPHGLEAVSAGDLDLPEPEETGETFVENAIIKAESAALRAKLPALADDSGLVVPSLGGAPGIYSARWAGPDKNFDLAMERVAELIIESEDRHAYFVCALALVWPDGHQEVFEGRVDGMLVWPKRGDQGFGYDPMFVPEGHDLTFGEMDPASKHAMSHRADAFEKMVAACFD